MLNLGLESYESESDSEQQKDELKTALENNYEDLVSFLLPGETLTSNTDSKLTFGRTKGKEGSITVNLTGEFAGQWRDWNGDEHGDVFSLIAHAKGLSTNSDFPKILEEARRFLGSGDSIPADFKPRPRKDTSKKDDATARKKSRAAEKIYSEAIPITGTIGEQYLRKTRKIVGPIPDTVLFHPRIKHWDGVKETFHPAIIIASNDRDDGTLVGIQRLYIDADTLTKIDGKSLGRIGDGVATLRDDGQGPVVIAEGLETALSFPADIPATVLMTMGIGNFEKQTPPAGRDVILISDGEGQGTNAWSSLDRTARKLTTAGHTVSIAKASQDDIEKIDLNDILQIDGLQAVRLVIESAALWTLDAENSVPDSVNLERNIDEDPMTVSEELQTHSNSDLLGLKPNFVGEIKESDLPRRQFLYGRHLIRGFTSTTVSPGGIGKTTLELTDHVALAVGRDLIGDIPHEGARRSWAYTVRELQKITGKLRGGIARLLNRGMRQLKIISLTCTIMVEA